MRNVELCFLQVGSIILRILWYISLNEEPQRQVQNELDSIIGGGGGGASADEVHSPMANSEKMHWARAAIFEAVRLTCSPIVPHRATRDTTLAGDDRYHNCSTYFNYRHGFNRICLCERL